MKLSPLAVRMCAGYVLSEGRAEIEQIVWQMPATVDASKLTSAWQAVVNLNPSLRVRLVDEGMKSDAITVESKVEVVLDSRAIDSPVGDAQVVGQWLREIKKHPFPIDQAPVFRLNLLVGNDGQQVLAWTFPHFLLDGRSISVILHQVASFLTASSVSEVNAPESELYLPEPEMEGSDASREWWKKYLADYHGTKPIPRSAGVEDLDSVQDETRTQLRLVLDQKNSDQIRQFAQAQGVGMGSIAKVAWALVLKSYLAEESVVFGSVRACRYLRGNRDDRLGVMMNILPFRVSFDKQDAVSDVLRRVRQDQVTLRQHERVDLSDIEKVAEVSASGRLFETYLMVDHEFPWSAALRVLGANHSFSLTEAPSAALVVTLRNEPCIDITVYAKSESVDYKTADEMLELFSHLLVTLPEQAATKVSQLELIAPTDRARIVERYNATAKTFPTGRLLQQSFEEIAKKRPSLTAVIAEDRTLTYGDLEAEANRLANLLISRGVKQGGLVVLRLERSSRLIVAMLATLKAGCGYVPLDPHWPEERVAYIIESTRAEAVVSSSELLSEKLRSDKVLLLDGAGAAIAKQSSSRPEIAVTEDAVAYIIFTSGSTGTPKGVVIDHRGVVNTIQDCNIQYNVTQNDRAFGISACTFDLSVYDIFGMLSAGAALVVCSGAALRDPDTWGQLIKQHRVTIWNSVPQLAEMLFESLKEQPEILSSLRLVMMSGDWIPIGLPDRIRQVSPGIALWSMGGATEASIWSIWRPIQQVDPKWKSIPYGYPMANQAFYVLDENLNPCPSLVAGDLYIGGIGLAKGYWADDEKTTAAFKNHPRWGIRIYKTGDMGRFLESGEIEFLGRKDTQVKLGGFRIELGEVEAVLARHPQVRDVVVTKAQISQAEGLAAYVIPAAGATLTLDGVRDFCRERLPEYMLPSALVELDKFPLSANGKVDRKSLPPVRDSKAASATGQSSKWPAELRQMAKLWQETTGHEVDSPAKTFFQAGGTSLLALRLIEKIKATNSYRLKLAELYQKGATLQALAKKIFGTAAPVAQTGSPDWLIPVRTKGSRPPYFFFGEFLDMGRLFDEDQPFYGFLLAVDHRGEHPNKSFHDLAKEKIEVIKSIQPHGPYHLGGYCFAGVLAVEVAAQMIAQGDEVRHLSLFEMPTVRSVGIIKRPWYYRFLYAFRRRLFEPRKSREELITQAEKKKEFDILMERLAFRNGDPFFDYTPQFLDIEVDYYVCRNSGDRFMPSSDPRNGWFRWFSKVRVHELVGDHHTFLRTPTLEQSVALIEKNLRASQTAGSVPAGQLVSV